MIELTGVQKSYRRNAGPVRVLHDVNLCLRDGEYAAIGGESGAGKTTLLNILGCLDRADTGSVRIEGIDVSGLDDGELATVRNRHIGFVFQTSHFVEHLDLVDNVALPARYRKEATGESARERARSLLTNLGLESRADHLPSELSGGERQRAAIARAMFNQPGLLLADEPTGNLDQRNTATICELLAALNADGVSIVLVTHDPRVAAHAQRRLTISNGELAPA